jgi:hypothetical protein
MPRKSKKDEISKYINKLRLFEVTVQWPTPGYTVSIGVLSDNPYRAEDQVSKMYNGAKILDVKRIYVAKIILL